MLSFISRLFCKQNNWRLLIRFFFSRKERKKKHFYESNWCGKQNLILALEWMRISWARRRREKIGEERECRPKVSEWRLLPSPFHWSEYIWTALSIVTNKQITRHLKGGVSWGTLWGWRGVCSDWKDIERERERERGKIEPNVSYRGKSIAYKHHNANTECIFF